MLCIFSHQEADSLIIFMTNSPLLSRFMECFSGLDIMVKAVSSLHLLQSEQMACAPKTLKSRFQTWNFPEQGMGRSSKDSHQNLHLQRNRQGNLSTFC